jgi:hypothetical protein
MIGGKNENWISEISQHWLPERCRFGDDVSGSGFVEGDQAHQTYEGHTEDVTPPEDA